MNIKDLERDFLKKLKTILSDNKVKSRYLVALALVSVLNTGFTTEKNTKVNTGDFKYTDIMLDLLEQVDESRLEESQLTIEERQELFLEKYNVKYLDMIKAVTEPVWGVDYTEADKIKARTDFEEMALEFKELTDRKIDYVLERYNISYEQLRAMSIRMLNESGGYNYNECCNVWSALLNRIFSQEWIRYVTQVTGQDARNIYVQFICPGQFGADNLPEKKFANFESWIGFYSGLDILCSGKPTHQYAQFRANWVKSYHGEFLEPGGNQYGDKVEDYVDNPTLVEVVFDTPPKLADFYRNMLDSRLNFGPQDSDSLVLCRKDSRDLLK